MKTYKNPTLIFYTDKRTGKTQTTPVGYLSDGATKGFDVCPPSFYGHDWGCGNYLGKGPKPKGGVWDDGTKMTNWELSNLHSDMLRDCAKSSKTRRRKVLLNAMAIWRWPFTFIFGGGVARINGMFKLKKVQSNDQ